jgi:hypothetical protein
MRSIPPRGWLQASRAILLFSALRRQELMAVAAARLGPRPGRID